MLLLLVTYSAALVALGWWVGRHVRHTSEFFVANRSLGAGLIFSTFLAANIGAGSTIGATGAGYREGLAAWWWNGSAGIGSFVLAFWVGPRLWREAADHGFLTIGDFLDHHYGRGARVLATVAIWCGSLFILTGQFIGGARVLGVAAGIPPITSVTISALVMTGYFAVGGMISSVWVNLVQLVVILLGFAIVTPLAASHAGGLAQVLATNRDGLNFFIGPGNEGWSWLFLLGPAFFLSPGLVQKSFGARDERALRRGVALNGIVLLLFACAPVVLGMTAHTLYPGWVARPDTELALPKLLQGAVPPAIGALAMAAVFSAEVSSADAVLFMLSTSGARDFYRGLLRPSATDAQVLRVARIVAVAGGLLSYGLTFIVPTVIDALTMFYSIMVVTLFAPVLGTLVAPGSGRVPALASVAAGLATFFAVHFGTSSHGFGWASASFLGLLTSGAVFLVMSLTFNVRNVKRSS
jgi:solute:Na+ symporter, SSS family